MKRVSPLAAALVAVLTLADPTLAQVPPAPADGTPATPATVPTAPANPAAPGTTPLPADPAAPGATPAGLPPAGPGTVTILLPPQLLQALISLLTGAVQPAPGAPAPGLPPLPPIAQPPGTPGAPVPGYTPNKKEAPIAGFPLLVIKGKKLIRTGPGLAATMACIQQGDQASAVAKLAETLQQMQACQAANPQFRPGKQAAATQAAYQIGVQTSQPAAPGAPAAPVTPASPATPPGNAIVYGDLQPPPAGQGGPPPVGLPPTPGKCPVNPSFANAVAAAQKQSSPLVLDLNGNGEADVTSPDWTGNTGAFNARGAVRFDVSGKGEAKRTEWLKPHADGLLVLDSNGNGVVDDATELFGDADGFNDGYAKLALLDANRDGVLTGAELSHLSVWVDDGDGVCQPGELKPVSALGITSIAVSHSGYASTFVRNGHTFKSWDWFPRAE